MNKKETIEAAYLAGFEPSKDNLSEHELFCEALEYVLQRTMAAAHAGRKPRVATP